MEKHRPLDLALASALFIAGLKLTSGIGEFIDLSFADEPVYLERGVQWLYDGTPLRPEWGPLYCMWYAGLVAAFGKVSAFYWSARFIVALLPVAAFFVARAVAAPIPSACAALFLLANQSLLSQWPKAGHFACLLYLITITVAIRLRTQGAQLILSGFGIVLATYARPEFLVALLPWSWLALKSGLGRKGWYLISVPIVAATVAHAFGHPWKDPPLSLRHVLTNAANLPVAFLRSCFTHWPFILPTELARASTWESVGLCVGLAWWIRKHAKLGPLLRKEWRSHHRIVAIILLPLLPAFLDALITAPPPRHLWWVPVLFCVALALTFSVFLRETLKPHWLVLAPLALIALTPTVGSRWITPFYPLAPNRDYVSALSALRLRPQPVPYRLAAEPTGHHAFLDKRFAACPRTGQPLVELIQSCQPELIVAEEPLRDEAFLRRYLPKYVVRHTTKQRMFLVRADVLEGN